MRRATIGTLDLSVIDEQDSDTQFLYDETFVSQIYHHKDMQIPDRATIMDVGANVGIYSIWAHRRYWAQSIYCYEASPRTFGYLEDNIRRLVDPAVTKIEAVNRAVASRGGETLVLHQPTQVSGLSTLLTQDQVPWLARVAAERELETHEVISTTVSEQIAAHRIATVDMLKIDVEGYFLEVLKGIAPADLGRIRNIAMECDFLPETGIKPDDVEALLQSMGFRTDCLDRTQDNNLIFYAWRA
jgi:phthiocerol/phenolphthiocerol synthesis type-I polyketide synthase E